MNSPASSSLSGLTRFLHFPIPNSQSGWQWEKLEATVVIGEPSVDLVELGDAYSVVTKLSTTDDVRPVEYRNGSVHEGIFVYTDKLLQYFEGLGLPPQFEEAGVLTVDGKQLYYFPFVFESFFSAASSLSAAEKSNLAYQGRVAMQKLILAKTRMIIDTLMANPHRDDLPGGVLEWRDLGGFFGSEPLSAEEYIAFDAAYRLMDFGYDVDDSGGAEYAAERGWVRKCDWKCKHFEAQRKAARTLSEKISDGTQSKTGMRILFGILGASIGFEILAIGAKLYSIFTGG